MQSMFLKRLYWLFEVIEYVPKMLSPTPHLMSVARKIQRNIGDLSGDRRLGYTVKEKASRKIRFTTFYAAWGRIIKQNCLYIVE
jgi:hypothetical protein